MADNLESQMTEAAILRNDGNSAATCLDIAPLTGTIGAEISGIRLADDHPDEVIEAIRDALDKFRVLVFRKQHDLDARSYIRFASRFGAPETVPHPSLPDYRDEQGEVLGVKVLESDADEYKQHALEWNLDSWHTDGAPRANRHWISLLQAVDVPDYGRDTMFADMVAAFECLSLPMQRFLEGLTCSHSWGPQNPEAAPVVHPMVVVHPRTGAKALYVNKHYTRKVNELRYDESQALLQFLQEQAKIPQWQLRLRWEPGTVAMWDNEYTQHYLVFDRGYRRVMHRIMMT
ncbi:MAG TPA: TauD/TfdA family dioxygenase [Novosphingobium sp.]|nr:TauD/TfdA family dioxygenase [Novosphingobium sp.]